MCFFCLKTKSVSCWYPLFVFFFTQPKKRQQQQKTKQGIPTKKKRRFTKNAERVFFFRLTRCEFFVVTKGLTTKNTHKEKKRLKKRKKNDKKEIKIIKKKETNF